VKSPCLTVLSSWETWAPGAAKKAVIFGEARRGFSITTPIGLIPGFTTERAPRPAKHESRMTTTCVVGNCSGKIDVWEAFQYVRPRVERAARLKGGKQIPGLWPLASEKAGRGVPWLVQVKGKS